MTLGVSHPSLEAIRSTTAAEPYKLSTKLTGAGGGGCSITLLPDGKQSALVSLPGSLNILTPAIDDALLESLMTELTELSYEPYLTSVGGSGLGVLSPYDHHRTAPLPRRGEAPGQVTPPQTPTPRDDLGISHEEPATLRPAFEIGSTTNLKEWAENLGRWLYV